MDFEKLSLPEIILIKPRIYEDERGFFFESFNYKQFAKIVGAEYSFLQDNHSRSSRGVIRGLHYQKKPVEQGKLVRVISGEVFDVAVDIRPDSPNFGKWVGVHLSAQNKYQLWIPPGFAHGFMTLSEESEFLYKTTSYYSPKHEGRIIWNDPDIAIDWPISSVNGQIIVSEKDQQGQELAIFN